MPPLEPRRWPGYPVLIDSVEREYAPFAEDCQGLFLMMLNGYA